MNPRELYTLRHGGIVLPSGCGCCSGLEVSRCPPPSVNSLNPPEPSDQKASYNGLSLNDVLFMQQFRRSDQYHKMDAISSAYHRGKGLYEGVKEMGTAKFVQLYQKK